MPIVEGVKLRVEVEGDTAVVKSLDRVLEKQVDVEKGAKGLEDQAVKTGQKLGEEVSQGAQKAEQSLQDLQGSTEKTAAETRQFAATIGDSAPNALSDFRRDLRRTADVAEDSGRRMRRTGGATRGLAQNLSQIAADSPFGFLGISNNLEMLFSSASRAKSQLGGFGAVARRLLAPGNLLTIGAGVVSALAVAFGDDLARAIFQSKNQLEEFKKALDEVINFEDVGGDPEQIEQQIATLEEELSRVRELREAFDEEDSTMAGRFLTFLQAEGGDFAVEQGVPDWLRRLSGLESSAESARLESLSDQKERLDEVIEQEEERLQKLRAQLRVIETLEGVGSAFLPEEEGQAPGPAPEAPEFLETPTPEEQQQTPLPNFDMPDSEFGKLEDSLDFMVQIQGQIGRINQMPFLTPAARAERRVRAVVRAIREARRQGRQFSRREINQIIKALDLAKKEAERIREILSGSRGSSDDSDDAMNQKIAQGVRLASQLGQELVNAFKKGEGEANKLFGRLLQIAGQAIALFNPIQGAVVSGIGGIIGAFDEGGYTGPGPQQQVAGIVHAGEYVMSKDAVDAAGGPMFFEAMHQMLTGSMSKSDLQRVAGMPPGYQTGGMVRSVTRPATGGGQSSSEMVSELRRQGEELSRLRRDLQRFADRPNLVRVDRRGSRDIVEAGQEYQQMKDPRQRG